eukprot:Nitzschia sp. Nitz4//scaffold335_size18684//15867//16661//NITZ4_008772-RA/size18684-processed-gene-0.7-mRNA-1//-1//CDS//3329548282//5484//frame0
MGAIVSTLAFPVPERTYSAAHLQRQGKRLVWFPTQKTRLRIPALYIQRPNARFTLLYSHGNAEDVGISVYYLEKLSAACNASVLAYEYPGYSIADGKKPSETLCCEAIQAAFRYLTETKEVDPSTIVLFGRSLGTGPTVHLASQQPQIAGTILQSPLESGIRCVIGSCASIALYPVDIFRNYAKVEKIQSPVFIVHGLADRVVPCDNGKALYHLLQQRPHHSQVAYDPVWLPGHGHNDMPQEYCFELFRDFLTHVASRPPVSVN